MITDAYGRLEALEDAQAFPEMDAAKDEATTDYQSGSLLWSYQHEGRINGVPVAEADVGLAIEKDDQLVSAFYLARRPKSVIMYMSPEADESACRYTEVLERAAAGEVEIVDEIKQWDSANSRFVLWLRYDELEYRLNERFLYLREEQNNG